jgi:hypothetical protein
MAKFIVPSSARMRINWDLGGVPAANVFGGKATGTGTVTQATADALRDIVLGAFNSSALGVQLAVNVSLTSVAIRNVNTADLPEFTSSVAGAIGTAPTEMLPRSVAAVVTFKTAKAGKRNRGRAFMPGFAEGTNESNGIMIQAAEDAAEAFWSAIDLNLGGTGYDFAVISPALPARQNAAGETLPAEGPNSEVITSVTVRNKMWGSQRGRNHRV